MRNRLCLLALLLTSTLSMAGCDQMAAVLSSYGFVAIRPASKLFAPGTVVWVSNKTPFSAGVICPATRAMGDDFLPTESPTISTELQDAGKKGANITANIADIITGNAELHSIKSVTMSLKNARILEITDWDVSNRNNLADERCLRAVLRRKRAGFTVSMIASALQADVTYSIKWDKKAQLDVSAKIAAMENLAVQLGLESSSVSDHTISADNLFWGIREDQFLAYLFDPAHLEKVDRGSRVLDPNMVPALQVHQPTMTTVPEWRGQTSDVQGWEQYGEMTPTGYDDGEREYFSRPIRQVD